MFDNATEVSFEQTLTTGTPIGEITIDGTTVVLYAPSGGGGSSVSYTDETPNGTRIGILSIDGVNYSVNTITVAPNPVAQPTAMLNTLQIGSVVYELPSGGGGGGGHTYSTTEHSVGTWIDGSIIYECTFDYGQDVPIGTNWTALTNIVIANVDRLIKVEGVNDTYGYCYPLIGAHDAGYLECKSSTSNDNGIRYFTVQYTKTS